MVSLLSPAIFAGLMVGNASVSPAAAPTGAGFTITKGDISYIIEQIRIAEAHTARTNSTSGPCGALIVQPGQVTLPYQLDHAGLPFGLRTVDGSCNNLIEGQEYFATAAGFESNPATGATAGYDYIPSLFPRYADPVYVTGSGPTWGPGTTNAYSNFDPNVYVMDTAPRTISNLIVDQTVTNPAAIAAAGNPLRAQNAEGIFPCDESGNPIGCTPAGETLFIENVTTDVGLSPPYNSMFTLFGQFFDHGIDQTVKGGGTVAVTLAADDPLVLFGPDDLPATGDEVPVGTPMFLSRGRTVLDENGVRSSPNTNSPWVDQSQTYASHPSHQVFLREYEMVADQPISTGLLLNGAAAGAPVLDGDLNHIDYGMATWESVKRQAAEKLGLLLQDNDVHEVPMIATDAYGNFIPGPLRGLPMYVTSDLITPLVEGDLDNPVAVPSNVLKNDRPFLTDLAHHANPTGKTPDDDLVATANHLDHAADPLNAGRYDDEMLNAHFIAGDGRVNENIGLTTIHQVFHSEHDRVAHEVDGIIQSDPDLLAMMNEAVLPGTTIQAWSYGERLFQIARFVTEMEYQHLVFEDFVRKMQPGVNPFTPAALIETNFDPAIHAEFAHAVYRFGHSMLTEDIDRKNADGSSNNISLLDGFLNPPEFFNGGSAGTLSAQDAAGSVVMGMSDQAGNELDEFVTDTLRNNLVGLPLDLASLNLTRGRSEGVPPLNVFRRDLYNKTLNGELMPYTSWVDFGQNIKHPESLVNFVAAYGTHPSIMTTPYPGPDGVLGDDGGTVEDESLDDAIAGSLKARRYAAKLIVDPDIFLGEVAPADAMDFLNATGPVWGVQETGLNHVDLWVGGLAEITSPFGGLLGTTFNFVFEADMTDLQNGDRFYYLTRTPGMSLQAQLEGNSFSELLQRNTNSHTLKADAFGTADCKFEMSNLDGTPAGFAAFGNLVADDPDSDCDESAVLIRKPDGTIQYRTYNSVDPIGINGQSVFNGTSGVDRMWGSNDNDNFWGNAGNDIMEGGYGSDIATGGEGDDRITDIGGDDIPKGGPGNDAIDAGPGLDIVLAGDGKDFAYGGENTDETFGGTGDDFMSMGGSTDEAVGGDGDDWMQGGAMQDLLIGDSMSFFFLDNSSMPGSDILIGEGGDDDYDMEGGDDVALGGPGIEKNAGQSGWDWLAAGSPGQGGDNLPLLADLAVPIVNQNIFVTDVRDRFDEVEALSGGHLNDELLGDDLIPRNTVDIAGDTGRNWISPATLALFSGLADVLPAGTDLNPLDGIVWGDGNMLLGGAGSDILTGRGANDIIDGDRYLNVRLSVRTDPADPLTEIGTTDLMEHTYQVGNPMTLQQAVFAGIVNPGNIVAVREVLIDNAVGELDIAAFRGTMAEYDISFANGVTIVNHIAPVANPGGLGGGLTLDDGIDIVRNVEMLRFADQDFALIAPAAPAITDVDIDATQATVVFTPPAPNGGSPITSFEIVVRNVTTSVDTVVSGIPATATSRLVTGLLPGNTFQFAVRAVNLAGPGALSAFSAPLAAVNTNPTITAQTPANLATGVLRASNMTVTFSEPMNPATISAANVILDSDAPGGPVVFVPVARVITYNSGTRTITIDPSVTLVANRVYRVRLLNLTDLAGNLLGPVTYTFTTGTAIGTPPPPAPGNTAPTVVSTSPADGSVGVLGRNDNVVVTFSEPVTGADTNSVLLVRNSNGAVVVVTVSFDINGRLIINPNGRLRADTLYDLTLNPAGAQTIVDAEGAQLPTTTVSFTTGPV